MQNSLTCHDSFFKIDPIDLRKNVTFDNVLNLPHSATAFLSYYAKGIPGKIRQQLNELFRVKNSNTHSLETFTPLEHLTEEERKKVFRNCGAIQLTYGCNGACFQCAVDATPGAQEHIPFPILGEIFERYSLELKSNPHLFLYFASDPLDYRWEDHSHTASTAKKYDYVDVHRLFQKYTGNSSYISTVIPNGSEDVFRRVKTEGIQIDRLSVMPGRKISAEICALLPVNGIQEIDGVNRVYNVEVRNGSIATTGVPNNPDSDGATDAGIGCFYGTLLTPRGVYNVVQLPGQYRSAPQKQIVIPYEGGSTNMPKAGDDIRDVLRQHVVVYSFSACSIVSGTQLFFIIEDPESSELLVVQHVGTDVTKVDKLSTIIDNAAMEADEIYERNTQFHIQCRQLLYVLEKYKNGDENWELTQHIICQLRKKVTMNPKNFLDLLGKKLSAPQLIGLSAIVFNDWMSRWSITIASPENYVIAVEVSNLLLNLHKIISCKVQVDPYKAIRKKFKKCNPAH